MASMSETAWPITATDFPGPKGSGPFFSSVMPAFELSSDMARCSSDPTTSVPIFWYLFGTATVMLHQETNCLHVDKSRSSIRTRRIEEAHHHAHLVGVLQPEPSVLDVQLAILHGLGQVPTVGAAAVDVRPAHQALAGGLGPVDRRRGDVVLALRVAADDARARVAVRCHVALCTDLLAEAH